VNAAAIEKIVAALPGGTAADFGSGEGRIVRLLRSHGYQVSGVESDPSKAQRAGVDCGDAWTWAPMTTVHLVTCVEMIEHCPARITTRSCAI
jgi:2-polyprenyl-3-methyl-5-hydroxy-6-metoxy-1,4-benzoquinol methylase